MKSSPKSITGMIYCSKQTKEVSLEWTHSTKSNVYTQHHSVVYNLTVKHHCVVYNHTVIIGYVWERTFPMSSIASIWEENLSGASISLYIISAE